MILTEIESKINVGVVVQDNDALGKIYPASVLGTTEVQA